MSRLSLLLLPVLALQAQDAPAPGAVEVRPGIFVLAAAPAEGISQALKRYRFTHVLDLRRDEEPGADCQAEAARLQELGIQYQRYALGKAPPDGDFDFVRALLRDLPRGARILIHCSNGNRAAAVVCPWLVLDRGMPLTEALRVAGEAGLKLPETQEAVRRYLRKHGQA
ncbi:hypothetical protein [Geothrix sp. 21YS21S-4]|uniref:hypothetical protein n=1 Tax=Geothrix sp. 21YS21S-4 TaxID=3068889 RepID=UPI0027B96C7B|nr:hypothetical protein [Geothrix sp. 21YS21S-4]